MRHIIVRGILAGIWLVAAVVCGVSGRFTMTAFYMVMCGLFLYFAYVAWKKETVDKGDQ